MKFHGHSSEKTSNSRCNKNGAWNSVVACFRANYRCAPLKASDYIAEMVTKWRVPFHH